MAKENLWKAFFMILAAVLGFGAGEVIDDDSKDCPACDEMAEPEQVSLITLPAECPVKVIAYVNNCETGEQDKYFCRDIGENEPCKSTEEILSELG